MSHAAATGYHASTYSRLISRPTSGSSSRIPLPDPHTTYTLADGMTRTSRSRLEYSPCTIQRPSAAAKGKMLLHRDFSRGTLPALRPKCHNRNLRT